MPKISITVWLVIGLIVALGLISALVLMFFIRQIQLPQKQSQNASSISLLTPDPTSQIPTSTTEAIQPSTQAANSPNSTSTSSSAPTFTKITEAKIDGANLWLFAINDGESKLALSTEQGNSIAMGRLDLENPSQRVSWQKVASSDDIGGEGIADHWHIFAHDAHWIVFSISKANRSFLVKLDKNFNRLAFTQVVDQERITKEEIEKYNLKLPSDRPAGDLPTVTTNDMFLVAEPDGVAVGHMIAGLGTKIYRFNKDAKLSTTTIIGGDYQFNNGSSAELTDNGILIYATETLNMVAQGAIKLIQTNKDWIPQSVITFLDEDRINLAMSTGVNLEGGYRVVTARAVSGAYPRGVMPPPPKPGQGFSDDSGAIVRYLFDSNNLQLDRTVITEKGNRPHTILVDDKLITTWDGNSQFNFRVDSVK